MAAGFVEPVESTAIHLAMSSILRLLKLFPNGDIEQSTVDEFNQQTREEMDRIRNFIILHYHATERTDTPFWRHCKTMDIPDALRHRVELFKKTGGLQLQEKELFAVDSWMQVMLGQGIVPTDYHPIVDMMTDKNLKNFLGSIRHDVDKKVAMIPSHQEFINNYCKAAKL